MTAPPKIGFVLLSPSAQPLPSTRIAVLNMFPLLRAAGFDPQVAFEPARATETPDLAGLGARLIAAGYAIVVFQKVHGASVEAVIGELRAAGVKTVYCVCDLIDGVMAAATDATVTVTEFLKSQYPPAVRHKISVVHDGIETPELRKTHWSPHRGGPGQLLRALLVTSAQLDALPQIGTPPNWLEVTILGAYPEQRGGPGLRTALRTLAAKGDNGERLAYLGFLAARRIQCRPWSEERVAEQLVAADIGIIPIDTRRAQLPGKPPPSWRVKSENRLTLNMSAGLPVIATPIPAYEDIIEHGVNGFFARSRDDWRTCLETLRDPDLRRAIGERARASVTERYSMRAQAAALAAVLGGLLPAAHRADIRIPSAAAEPATRLSGAPERQADAACPTGH
jgi:glycosyltransferase involved in cell wall biosynthesis